MKLLFKNTSEKKKEKKTENEKTKTKKPCKF